MLYRHDDADPGTFARVATIALGAVLLFSPVVTPWYVTWLLPVGVIAGIRVPVYFFRGRVPGISGDGASDRVALGSGSGVRSLERDDRLGNLAWRSREEVGRRLKPPALTPWRKAYVRL